MPRKDPDPGADALGKRLVRTAKKSHVLQLYRDAENELLEIVRSGDPRDGFTRYRREQYRAIDIVIGRLEGEVRRAGREEIEDMAKKGDRETLAAIDALQEEAFAFRFAGVNEDAVRILTEELYNDFARTVIGLRASARKGVIDRAKVSDTIIRGTIQGKSFSQTGFDVVKNLKDQGFEVLKAKNGFGRSFNLEQYSNLLVRTHTMRAYNLGGKGRMLGAGRRFAIFPTIRPDIDGEDICNEWEEKRYIDLLTDPIPPESTHPHCRHSPRPVSFEQLRRERPDLFKIAMDYFESVAGFRPAF